MNKNLLPNKFFSWLTIGIIIYVLFFHQNEMPDGSKVSSMQQMFSGTPQPTAPVTPPTSSAVPAASEPTLPAAKDDTTLLAISPNPSEENPFLKDIDKNPLAAQDGINAAARSGGNRLADLLQNVIGVSANMVKEGFGPPAHCGQTVTIHFTEYMPDGEVITSTREKGPITITLGEGKVIKALEIGLEGMRKGGTRKLVVPAKFAHNDKKFQLDSVPENTTVTVDVELVDFKPTYILKETGFGLKTYDDGIGLGSDIGCGDTIMLNYKIWDIDTGKLLASTLIKDPDETNKNSKVKKVFSTQGPSKKRFSENISQPVIFKLGSDEAPYGMELGLLTDYKRYSKAMKVNGKRTMIIPAYLMKTMTGKNPSKDIINEKLPANKTVLVEVEVVEKIKTDDTEELSVHEETEHEDSAAQEVEKTSEQPAAN